MTPASSPTRFSRSTASSQYLEKIIPPYQDTDPATEFLDYVEVRNRLRRGEMSDSAAAVYERYGLRAPGAESENAVAALARLEKELPEPFTALAGNADFVSLIEAWNVQKDRHRVLSRVRENVFENSS